MNIALEYNPTDPQSIESYAKHLIGKTFSDVCNEDKVNDVILVDDDYEQSHEDRKRKGGLGDLIEERFFHYKCNSDSRPDFPDAGVELKVTPYKKNKNGSLSAKERLVITMIDYFRVVDESFDDSHLWNKARLILLVYYLYREETTNRLDYKINYTQLFTPPKEDLQIIRQDYDKIVAKIREGKAHELSESDTIYLGACTKGANSSKRRGQPFSDEVAKPRAFCFKASYMTYVLNNYVTTGKQTYESIIKTEIPVDFEGYITDRINAYRGHSLLSLCKEFNLEIMDFKNPPKNLGAIIANRMLGVKGDKAAEFEKGNIQVKSIRIEASGTIKESMSFPSVDFMALINEEWEDSQLCSFFNETRFLFVVFRDVGGEYIFDNAKFWNMSYDDLRIVKKEWTQIRDKIANGVTFRIEGNRVFNDIPGMKETEIIHMRPHTSCSAYKLNDGFEKGDIGKDACQLPDGQWMTKQSFWLNHDYVLKIVQ